MVATVIAAVVVTSVYTVFVKGEKGLSAQRAATGIQMNSRALISWMERDIRRAGSQPGGFMTASAPAPSPLAEADASHIRLVADLNGDGDTSDADEDITYRYTDTDADGTPDSVERIDASTGKVLRIKGVSNFKLTYLTASGEEVETPDPVASARGVKIELEMFAPRVDQPEGSQWKNKTQAVVIFRNFRS